MLEYYYISMLTASDTQSHYGNNTARSGLDEAQRDELARHVWDFLLSFEPWRRQARNALWPVSYTHLPLPTKRIV